MMSMLHNLVLTKDLFKMSCFLNVGAFTWKLCLLTHLSYKSANILRSFRMLLVMVMVMMNISYEQ